VIGLDRQQAHQIEGVGVRGIDRQRVLAAECASSNRPRCRWARPCANSTAGVDAAAPVEVLLAAAGRF
jgi:hypothetical protein